MVKRLLPRPWQCCGRARWHRNYLATNVIGRVVAMFAEPK
jgi:hypothetical protein